MFVCFHNHIGESQRHYENIHTNMTHNSKIVRLYLDIKYNYIWKNNYYGLYKILKLNELMN